MGSLKRYDIINALIKKYGYKSYLEIGTQGDMCIKRVDCLLRVGIDPNPVVHNHDYIFSYLTSNEFFKKNTLTFDIIFIDGLHHAQQVRQDIFYSLKILNEGGVIVVHDCNPSSEERQIVPEMHLRGWNGDVWKAWIVYRNNPNLSMFVINEDEGCGVLRRGSQVPVGVRTKMLDLQYADLEANRVQWLNLVEYSEDIL
jgi:hypothetical protein